MSVILPQMATMTQFECYFVINHILIEYQHIISFANVMVMFDIFVLFCYYVCFCISLHQVIAMFENHSKQNIMEEYKNILLRLDEIEKLAKLSYKRALNIDDVSLLTGLSKSHIYRLTCSHQIPHYKPSAKALYFEKSEIEHWMLQNRVTPKAEAESTAIKHCL